MKNIASLIIIFGAGAIWYYTHSEFSLSIYIVIAIMLGLYMAMNIWANDVANSVWPAVWSKTISLKLAIIIAAIWNASWAMIAGWEVVKTIKKWIINIDWFSSEPITFIFAMIAALLAAALWLNVATFFRAPVSTTHSIVGWVMWAWIAAFWINVVSWSTVWAIAISWVISPVLWWAIAALFLLWIKKTILFKEDKVTNAKKWVPFFLAIMAWAFSTYLILKWLKNLIKIDFLNASLIWLAIAFVTYLLSRYKLSKTTKIKNNRESVNLLFTIPLIAAVWLLTFAHWANDVANAIWPIAAIYDAVINWNVAWAVEIPFWILAMWGLWISLWLAFYWPRIISTVWTEITELDRIRAFSIALAASITVIIASQLWLPVSSTHIALGWVFWVWFLRERLDRKAKVKCEKYVKRELITKIVSAWLITLPVVAFISWMIYLLLVIFIK